MSLIALWMIMMVVYFLIYIYVINKRSEKLDILPIFIYNENAYWKDDENIYRCKIINGQIDLKNSEQVDPENLYDISNMDYLLITQKLEDMN